MALSGQALHASRLEVEPRQFAKALKILARLDRKEEWAEIDFDGGMLLIRLGDTEQRIPAAGSWTGPLHFRSRFARALSERPVLGAPLELSVEDDRLTVGTFSFPCSTEPPPVDSGNSNQERHAHERLAEAAYILKKLHVSQETVAALVAKASPEYANLWSGGYESMIDRIANAWKILGPMGVDPRDIRQAIEESVRYAFHASAGRKKE